MAMRRWLPVFVIITMCVPTRAQEQTWKMLSPAPAGNCQTVYGPDGQNTYTIGAFTALTAPGEPLRVNDVTVEGPASTAGIQKGDLLWGSDTQGKPVVIDACE